MEKKAGEWAFLIGFLLAVLFVFLPSTWKGTATLVLVILGLVVGFLNISERESTPFLVAAAALMITASAGGNLAVITWFGVGSKLQAIVQNIAVFVAPAAIVVAIKSLRSLAKD